MCVCVRSDDGGGETGENTATSKIRCRSRSDSHVCRMIPNVPYAEPFHLAACGAAGGAAVCLQPLNTALAAHKAAVKGLCCATSTERPLSRAARKGFTVQQNPQFDTVKFGAFALEVIYFFFYFVFQWKFFFSKNEKKNICLVLTLELSGYGGASERSHPAVSHPRGHEKIQLQTHSTYLDIYNCFLLLMEIRCCFFHAVNKSQQISEDVEN